MTTDLLARPVEDVEDEVKDHEQCERTAIRWYFGLIPRRIRQCEKPAEWIGRTSKCGHPISVCDRHLRHDWPWNCCSSANQAIIGARRI